MLDQLNSLRNKKRFTLSTTDYRPEKAITSRVFRNCYQDKLAVLFSPWHGATWLYERLARRLEKSGWSVICYEFSPEILKPDTDQVIASFNHLQTAIADDLREVTRQNSYEQVHLIGTSLGNLPLALAAERFHDFTDVTMVAASSNLAQGTWEGLRTQAIRNEFIKQGMTESDLDSAWAVIAPKNHVAAFAGKPLNLIISKTDRVIPTKLQMEYQAAVITGNANVTSSYTRLGHYGSIIKFCLFGQVE